MLFHGVSDKVLRRQTNSDLTVKVMCILCENDIFLNKLFSKIIEARMVLEKSMRMLTDLPAVVKQVLWCRYVLASSVSERTKSSN